MGHACALSSPALWPSDMAGTRAFASSLHWGLVSNSNHNVPAARTATKTKDDLGGRGSGSRAKGASGGAAPPAEKVKAPEGGAQRCAASARSALTATARPAVTASAAMAMLGLRTLTCRRQACRPVHGCQ
jgi:hypothetical protein